MMTTAAVLRQPAPGRIAGGSQTALPPAVARNSPRSTTSESLKRSRADAGEEGEDENGPRQLRKVRQSLISPKTRRKASPKVSKTGQMNENAVVQPDRSLKIGERPLKGRGPIKVDEIVLGSTQDKDKATRRPTTETIPTISDAPSTTFPASSSNMPIADWPTTLDLDGFDRRPAKAQMALLCDYQTHVWEYGELVHAGTMPFAKLFMLLSSAGTTLFAGGEATAHMDADVEEVDEEYWGTTESIAGMMTELAQLYTLVHIPTRISCGNNYDTTGSKAHLAY